MFRVQTRGNVTTLFLEVEDTDEIILVVEMDAIEAASLAAKLLLH